MSFINTIKHNRIFHICFLIFTVIYLYFVVTQVFKDDPKIDEYDINEILSGSSIQSDIEKHKIPNQSLIKPFVGSNFENSNWEFHGDTLIKKDNFVRLTSEKPQQSSLIQTYNSIPESIKGLEIDFTFSINSADKKNKGLKADGFALFLTKDRLVQGPVFGVNDYFKGLGLFFDTYRNSKKGKVFPYISLMNGNGHSRYDKENDGRANEIAGCSARGIYNPKEGDVKARLIYTEDDGYLSFDYSIYNNKWVNCFSVQDFELSGDKWLSFGGETGELFENVDIFEVEVNQLMHHDNPVSSYQEYLNQEEEENFELNYKDKKRNINRNDRKIRSRDRRAKLQAKARNKKSRAQNLNKEKYVNNDSNFIGRFFNLIWILIKWILIILIGFIIVYIGWTYYRVKIRSKRKVGLLD
ncbi:hypothetical protein WICMUC_002642 [Wickerhamomyces mucosus]|uniref:L-type lectin-like domain-containing protein n=1 Tax=Wickerhamomyces mucosus TaxID=1378264 RepID=A0A9P8PNK8_9ASCO|nr:hypothetical protein WICMUC_002642 [Wickerhamomyces mucosus]